MTAPEGSTPRLARALGLATLVFYGVGDVLGAGIYAVTGKVAGAAGRGAWISFAVAAALAGVTGLSYAEMAARVPRAGGAASYAAAAFRARSVPFVVGFLVLASGLTSAATVSRAVHGYLEVLFDVPELAAAAALILLMSLVSWIGIRISAGANVVMTAIESGGILLVIVVGFSAAAGRPAAELAEAITPDADAMAVLAGAVIAFYSFIGFEDLANLAEEAKDPTRDLPRAILAAVGISTVFYLAVAFVVLWTMSPADAEATDRPLLEVLRRTGTRFPDGAFAVIALIAVTNTGLVNLVMASRLLYGMAEERLLPRGLAAVDRKRHTPWAAVVAAGVLCLALSLTGAVRQLAGSTSLLLLIVFTVVHASVLVLRRRGEPHDGFRAPAWTPWAGIALAAVLAAHASADAWLRAGIAVAAAFVIHLAARRRWGR